jgi:hypothetical protein
MKTTQLAHNAPQHSKDSDCTVDWNTGLCKVCGVDHGGDLCPDCGQRAFHSNNCPAILVECTLAEAQVAFWKVVIEKFPEASNGDLSPDTAVRLSIAAHEAIAEWIKTNVPEKVDAQDLLDRAALLQTQYWDALSALEDALGVDVDGQQELLGRTVDSLITIEA